jgi:23S rRNA (adenine1618-N6)-methyltransferase
MCNPPLYSSDADMLAAYGAKAMLPSAVCTGSTNEMICPGGDVGFVTRILDESLKLRTRVQWYSSMLGRLVSVHQLVAKLKEYGITNFAVTNLKAGQKTRRWAVAWSFGDARPRNGVARHGELVQAILPLATEWTIQVPGVVAGEAGEKVDATLECLDLKWQWRAAMFTGVASTKGNVWSRAARRKRKFEEAEEESKKATATKDVDASMSDDEDEEIGLVVKIVCSKERVDVRWLRGTDAVLWESFCGMLKRALGARENRQLAPKAKAED